MCSPLSFHCVYSCARLQSFAGNLSVEAHLRAEHRHLSGVLNVDNRVTIIDGGSALQNMSKKFNPHANLWRCSRHLTEQLKHSAQGRKVAEEYAILHRLPPGRAAQAQQLADAAFRYTPLANVPLSHISQSHLPPGVGLHGNTTNNMVEILHVMNKNAREQGSLYRSLLATVQMIGRRAQHGLEKLRAAGPIPRSLGGTARVHDLFRAMGMHGHHVHDVRTGTPYPNHCTSHTCVLIVATRPCREL
jgi:hypothetical protein